MDLRPVPVKPARRLTAPLAVGLAALGVAAAVLAVGLTPGPGGATPLGIPLLAAATPAAAPTGSPGPGWRDGAGRGWMGGPGMGTGPGMMGGGRGFGDGRRFGGVLGQITISAIEGTKISLKSATGWTRTIDVASIPLTKAGLTISAIDLKVGDTVALGESRAADGSFTLSSLTVVLDEVAGSVTRIDATSITVSDRGGTAVTIKTSTGTVYRRAGQSIARSDIAVGARIEASGSKASDGSLTAVAVDVAPDVVVGTVSAKSGSTLTIATAGGGTATVKVTGTTTYTVAGKASATLADVAVNNAIQAEGVRAADGTLTATSIRAGALGGPGWGPGMGGHGFGRQGGPAASPAPTKAPGTSG